MKTILTLKWKKYIYIISGIECGKSVPIYLYTLKMTCLGCFKIKGEGSDNNETGLKEGEGIEMSIYSASIHSTCNDNYNSSIVTQ